MSKMFVKLLLPLFVLSLSAVRAKNIRSDDDLPILGVVGGTTASPKQIPYQVSLEYYGLHKCGGTIISNNYVLTAAHCTEDITSKVFYIRAGSVIRNEGGQLIKVKDFYPHPLYNSVIYDYDVSVLELQSPLIFDSFVKPAKLPKENEPVTATTATASGWGQLSEEKKGLSTTLQFLELPIWKQEECEKFDRDITDRMICAGYPQGGKDTCEGDSGGPLASRGKLIAIISWGYGCANAGNPGVLTNVASVRQWINNVTRI